MSEVGLDIETIYKYDNHKNIPWNITEYQPLKQYLDPGKILADRARENGGATERYVTKKRGFLDQHIKNVKDLPAPCTYECDSEFDQTLNKKQSHKHKIDFKLKKNTYLEQIQSLSKRYKSPGTGAYNLRKESKGKTPHKKYSIQEKRHFYQDNEFLSTGVPGSACYYPHQEVLHIKKQRTNHHFWVDKHKKEAKRDRKRSLKQADPGTYRPVSAQFNSFDKMKNDHEKRKKRMANKKPHHGFGSSDAKFDYTREKKSLGETKPDPCHYNTAIEWKGKGADAKKNNWVRCLSAGPSRSIYH